MISRHVSFSCDFCCNILEVKNIDSETREIKIDVNKGISIEDTVKIANNEGTGVNKETEECICTECILKYTKKKNETKLKQDYGLTIPELKQKFGLTPKVIKKAKIIESQPIHDYSW